MAINVLAFDGSNWGKAVCFLFLYGFKLAAVITALALDGSNWGKAVCFLFLHGFKLAAVITAQNNPLVT